jgi:hypothetical protein
MSFDNEACTGADGTAVKPVVPSLAQPPVIIPSKAMTPNTFTDRFAMARPPYA